MTDTSSVAIVILNFNGKKHLSRFLPSVLENAEGSTVYVADNASTDDSVEFIRKQFPSVKLIRNSKNHGYAGGYNEALKHVHEKYLVLLNNDVEVTKHWLTPVIKAMEQDALLAACQPKMLQWDQKDHFEYAGASGGFIDSFGYPFCRGRIFHVSEIDSGQYDSNREIFWASGACLFIRNDLFHLAGGFDSDYFAHMEEIDLCWRLRNLGYSIQAVPESVIYHLGGGTLNKISSGKTFLNFRNSLITLVKNDGSSLLFLKVLWRLLLDGVAGAKFLVSGDVSHCIAVIRAHFSFYGMLGSTLRKRKSMKQRKGFRFSDVCRLNGSIVAKFYLNGKKRFSDLSPHSFHQQ